MIEGISLKYHLPNGFGDLLVEDAVLKHISAHRQSNCLAKEAGGQLFADLTTPSLVRIVEATGPRPTDRRSIFHYHPDRNAERLEIAAQYAAGRHFVGDWHTHPQSRPKPSATDLSSMREMVSLSRHELAGFLMVILGRSNLPDGLHVSFHTPESWSTLKANIVPNYAHAIADRMGP